jgi:hypothetical protein
LSELLADLPFEADVPLREAVEFDMVSLWFDDIVSLRFEDRLPWLDGDVRERFDIVLPFLSERSAALAPDAPPFAAAVPVADEVVPEALLPALPCASAPIEKPSDRTAAANALLWNRELDISGSSLPGSTE